MSFPPSSIINSVAAVVAIVVGAGVGVVLSNNLHTRTHTQRPTENGTTQAMGTKYSHKRFSLGFTCSNSMEQTKTSHATNKVQRALVRIHTSAQPYKMNTPLAQKSETSFLRKIWIWFIRRESPSMRCVYTPVTETCSSHWNRLGCAERKFVSCV